MIIDLFSPKKLLEKEMSAYVSYMDTSIRVIIIVFALLLILIPILVYFFDERDFFTKFKDILSLYNCIFDAGIVLTLTMLFIQSCITRKHKQVSIDLEKANKAIELTFQWSKESSAEMLLARKIVDRLSTEETKKLVDGNEPISISRLDYEMLCGFFPNHDDKKQDDSTNGGGGTKSKEEQKCPHDSKCPVANSKTLSMFETLWLRSWVVKYLNIMEIIMYAWKADIVDKNVIENEFSYLVKSERDGSVVLSKYRELSGQENYPGIYSFCNTIAERNKKRIEEIQVSG